jgi:hypothetical protein
MTFPISFFHRCQHISSSMPPLGALHLRATPQVVCSSARRLFIYSFLSIIRIRSAIPSASLVSRYIVSRVSSNRSTCQSPLSVELQSPGVSGCGSVAAGCSSAGLKRDAGRTIQQPAIVVQQLRIPFRRAGEADSISAGHQPPSHRIRLKCQPMEHSVRFGGAEGVNVPLARSTCRAVNA